MSSNLKQRCDHHRVIIHIDFDCYYAQVEMVKNPELKDKPVGVRQKYLLVTCNYVARDRGVKKLMPMKQAQEICPQLVIVPGEDLTEYREVSYNVSRHLQAQFPLVERLGLDENFIDATEEVEKRLQENNQQLFHVVGHLLTGNDSESTDELTEVCPGDCHRRLNLGSTIAQEIRDSVFSTFQLTCCAGVAHNKLLAKMAGTAHKPNQQSVLYPEHAAHFLHSLPSISKIPGIGPSMLKKLSSNSIETLFQLQESSISKLDSILGKGAGITVQNLSYGIDNSPVVPSGKPLSLGLEDAVLIGMTIHDCQCKLNQMLEKLMGRIIEDGRVPHTIRLVLRKGTGGRESRQCPLPPEVYHSAKSNPDKKYEKIASILMSLLTKMVDTSSSAQLTLIGITFTKLIEPEKTSIQRFLKRASTSDLSGTPSNKEQTTHCDMIPEEPYSIEPEKTSLQRFLKRPSTSDISETPSRKKQSARCDSISKEPEKTLMQRFLKQPSTSDLSDTPSSKKQMTLSDSIPDNVDPDIFRQLPGELKQELLEEWSNAGSSVKPRSSCVENIPHNIDAETFMELPDDIKYELRQKWEKRQPQKKCVKGNTIMNYFSKS